jgi:Acyl-CoA dehydrogenase, C-terminal domain
VTSVEDSDDVFLSSAQDALRSTHGEDALGMLGWADLLGSLEDDPDARRAVFAYFRAQGRELGSSGALGILTAHPYADMLGDDCPATAAVERHSARRGSRPVLVGELRAGRVLIDRPGRGASLVELDTIELRPIGLSDGLALLEVESDLGPLDISLGEAQAVTPRDRSVTLGRMALAHEMLGAAEIALAGAVAYARDRQQFGQPIGHFQAVRHLLAAARVDCAAIEALAEQSVELYPALPPLHDAILKAVAGRNGRRICERSLQVLGAIGFTAEHVHHRLHSRVLVLDSLLGTSSSLAYQVAVTLRGSEGLVPDLNLSVAGR